MSTTPSSKSDLDQRFDLAREAGRLAGRMLVADLVSDFDVTKKGRINLVTEMDLKAERLITDLIGSRFPDDEILAEERGRQEGSSGFKWIIDPIDGTTNYAHGYRFFCVSIALEVEGDVVAGAVYDPVTDEMFSALKGEGAHLNGSPMSVSQGSSLLDCLLCTGFSYELESIREGLKLFERFVLRSRAVRRDGSAALDLCYVAAGRFDGFWELTLNPWDVAAGQLFVSEAGGRVSRFDGSPGTIYDGQILATNGRIHDEMIRVLTQGA